MKKLGLLLLFSIPLSWGIPDFNIYLYKQKNNEKIINWNKVLNMGSLDIQTEKVDLINLSPYYVEKHIREYSSADVVLAVRNNQVELKTKSINKDFSLISYDFNDQEGCLSYNISIIDKTSLLVKRLNDKLCYANDIQNYPTRTFTYNTPISNYTNNQNGYSYLFIFDNQVKNSEK